MALRDWAATATLAIPATVDPPTGPSVATVATVAVATPPKKASASVATPANRLVTGEIRELLAIISADWPADEKADALAAALADPDGALRCFRALVAERDATTPTCNTGRIQVEPGAPVAAIQRGEQRMATCRTCANLSPGGRCLAAWRGESLGNGIGTGRNWGPQDPDAPLCCGAYAPLASDPDQRTGRQRWPFLFAGWRNE